MADPKSEFHGLKKYWFHISNYDKIKKLENKFMEFKIVAQVTDKPSLIYVEKVGKDSPMIWVQTEQEFKPPAEYIILDYIDLTNIGDGIQAVKQFMKQGDNNSIWVKPVPEADQIIMKLKYEEILDGFN